MTTLTEYLDYSNAPDQLDSYSSDQPNDPDLWTIEHFVDEVDQVRQALGLNKDNFFLYGQSWGGMLAIEYALLHHYTQYVLRMPLDEWPDSIMRTFKHLNKDLYVHMQGHSEFGMTPNALLPGSTEFPGGGWEMMREAQPEIYEMVRKSVPSGRLGTPTEVADAAVWLVSPRAGWVNGAALVVDGGQSKAIR